LDQSDEFDKSLDIASSSSTTDKGNWYEALKKFPIDYLRRKLNEFIKQYCLEGDALTPIETVRITFFRKYLDKKYESLLSRN
jgi:hypothetical protein